MIECVFPCVRVCDRVGRVYVQSRRGYVCVRTRVLGAVSQHVSVFLTTCVCVCVEGGDCHVSMCSTVCMIMCVTVYLCEGSRAYDSAGQFSFPCPLLMSPEPLRKKIMRSRSQGLAAPTLPGHRGQGDGLGNGRWTERKEAGGEGAELLGKVGTTSFGRSQSCFVDLSFSFGVLSHFSHFGGPERPTSCSSFPQSKKFPEKKGT